MNRQCKSLNNIQHMYVLVYIGHISFQCNSLHMFVLIWMGMVHKALVYVEHLFFLAVMLLQNHSLSEIRRDWNILTDVFSEETTVKQNFLVSTDLAEINFGGQPLFYIFKIYSCCHPFVWLFPLMLNAENTYSLIEKRLVQLKIRETADKVQLL